MPSPDTPQSKNLRDLLEELQKREWVLAATDPRLGTLNFGEIVPDLNGFALLLRKLARSDLAAVPVNRIQSIINSLRQFTALLEKIQRFEITRENPLQDRNQLQDSIRDSFQDLFSLSAPVISFSAASESDLESLQATVSNQARSAVQEELSRSQTAVRDLQEASHLANETVEAIKRAAAQGGVSTHARIFLSQADEHRTQANRWAVATAITALITVCWGAVALWWIPVPPDSSTAVIVQEALAKFIVFSGLSYALLWCARNYSANRHNYVLNKHRENSLATFETFAKAAEGDPEIKSAILLQATTSIFAAQATGYSTKEPEVDQPSKIIEIMRSAKGS